MRKIALALLIFSFPSPSFEVEIRCNTSLESPDEKDGVRFGDCITVNPEYIGSKLRIISTHSIKDGGFQSIDIEENTSYSLIPPKSPHLIAPDMFHFKSSEESYDTRTHYFERKPEKKITLCSPLHCITIPHSPSYALLPLPDFPSETNSCAQSNYLPLGFLGQSASPVGLCIVSQESPDGSFPLLQNDSTSALYYFSLKNSIKQLISFHHPGNGSGSYPLRITPSHHTSTFSSSVPSEGLPSDSLSFYSYDLSSHIKSNAAGFSLSHNFHRILINEDRFYSIKTPTRVYSLFKLLSGGYTLFPEPGEKDTFERSFDGFLSVLLSIDERRRAERDAFDERKGMKGAHPNYDEEPRRETLILHLFKESEFFFKGRKDIGPVGRFGVLDRIGFPFAALSSKKETTGYGTLKRFFDLEKEIGGDWKTVPKDIAHTAAGKAVFERKDLFLYNWLGYLRSQGEKRKEGVYEQWTDLFKNILYNWDNNFRTLNPPKVVREMPPLVEEEPMSADDMKENSLEEKKEQPLLTEQGVEKTDKPEEEVPSVDGNTRDEALDVEEEKKEEEELEEVKQEVEIIA